MIFRPSLGTLLLSAMAVLSACSGGGNSSPSVTAPACAGTSKFCLISCNLGCTVNGDCAVTEIAQNQLIVLNFSQVLDPASLTGGSVQIRTASGEAPAGQLLVDGSSVVFQPEARVVGGSTQFGFRPNETYVLTLPGAGQGSTLTSSSGDPLDAPVVCQLNVTQGVIDNDGQAPIAELITPTTNPAAQDTQIQIRFSELIDLSSFVGTTAATSPIRYTVRPTVTDPLDPTARICDNSASPGAVSGVPVASIDLSGGVPRTVISLAPTTLLPRRACIDVIVTERIRDLAGVPATRSEFQFFVEEGTPTPLSITETFANSANIDIDRSGGIVGAGLARPTLLGGTGVDGSFDPQLGTLQGTNTFVFNTTNTFLPGVVRRDGQDRTVTDGLYEFSDFIIPQGTRVIFRGAVPAVIRVAGRVQIDGTLDVAGVDVPAFTSVTPLPGNQRGFTAGQTGGIPGAGGGAGGDGGDSGNTFQALDAFDGKDGGELTAPALSGYASQTTGTGGEGSIQFPASGVANPAMFPTNLGSFPLSFGTVAIASAGGGAGGGYVQQGGVGAYNPAPNSLARTSGPNNDVGPATVGGSSVMLMNVPGGVTSSIDHFLVGGSGGGGGGSSIFGARSQQVIGIGARWNAGAAGGGGGGAICLRAGRQILVNGTGAILASGGDAGQQPFNVLRTASADWPTPGGGGSGGTILLQCGIDGGLQQLGTLDVSGGIGGVTNFQSFFPAASEIVVGGAGSVGFVRGETPSAPMVTALGNVVGPSSLGALSAGALLPTDFDPETVILSKFRSIGTIFPPDYLSYTLTVRLGSGPGATTVVYTDEGADPTRYANFANGPLELTFQGATVAPGSNVGENPASFRSFINANAGPSINSDAVTGLRWLLRFDNTAGIEIEVLDLVINAQG